MNKKNKKLFKRILFLIFSISFFELFVWSWLSFNDIMLNPIPDKLNLLLILAFLILYIKNIVIVMAVRNVNKLFSKI